MGVNCLTFVNFDEMLNTTKPDLIIVTTVDATHHKFIIKGLEFGCDVLTEKPLTTDENKSQAILNAERKSGKILQSDLIIDGVRMPQKLKKYWPKILSEKLHLLIFTGI